MDNDKNRLKIGNYMLGKTIGRGTFAKVKEGIHVLTSEAVAIKILDKTKIQDEDDKQRILRELEILRKVRHPNIIQLYQVFETQQQIYIINQFAERGELFQLVNQSYKLKEKTCARIFLQIINAVEYLHRLGISHRDLKPQNILLDFDYNIKLVDFGLSNYYKKGDLLKTACGSPCYAPPEMVAGKLYDGFLSDVWSMGIIFFVMTCGYLPFQQKTTKQLYAKIIEGKYELPKKISVEAKQAIDKMLNSNPTERIQLNKIRSLKYFKSYLDMQPVIIGIMLGIHPMPIDLQLLKSVSKNLSNIDCKIAEEMIRSNKHNQVTSSYYLYQKKMLREGGKTNIDLQIYLESSRQYRKDYGQTPIDQMKSKSIESVTNYQIKNRSLKKKVLINKKTNRIQSVTKKKNQTTFRQKSKEKDKQKQRIRLRSQGNAPTSLDKQKQKSTTTKRKIRLNTLTSQQLQKTLTMTMPKNSQKPSRIWQAYINHNNNNNIKLSQTTRVNLKNQQKQKLYEQNLSKIKSKTKTNQIDKLPGILFSNRIDQEEQAKYHQTSIRKKKQFQVSPPKPLLSHRKYDK